MPDPGASPRIKDTMEIEGPDGKTLATVKKALITPVRDRWTVKIKDGPDLDVQGNILDHEYRIEEGRHKVAEVSKKRFRLRDTCGVEVAESQDDVVILAVTGAVFGVLPAALAVQLVLQGPAGLGVLDLMGH